MDHSNIVHITSPSDIQRCFPIMKELRPHVSKPQFEEQVRRQQKNGYHLIACLEGDAIVAVSGYRLSENLAWGKFLYIDDLVTTSKSKSKGYGQKLIGYLIEEAKKHGCTMLHLDSGVQRFAAHRFYIKTGMDIKSHHFSMSVSLV